MNKRGEEMMYDKYEVLLQGDKSRFVGPGHNACIVQDDESTDWMLCFERLSIKVSLCPCI
ncbi:MAG: hypothetical protein LBV43_09020 [Prevotella sp.]|nr:hypothetical protein [Prevotella sp.]